MPDLTHMPEHLVQLREVLPDIVDILDHHFAYGSVLAKEDGTSSAFSTGPDNTGHSNWAPNFLIKLSGWDGKTTFSTTTNTTDPSELTRLAHDLCNQVPGGSGEIPDDGPIDDHFTARLPGYEDVGPEIMLATVRDLSDALRDQSDRITSPLAFILNERRYTLYGAKDRLLSQEQVWRGTFLNPAAQADKTQVKLMECWNPSQANALNVPIDFVERMGREVVELLKAEKLTPGPYTVIMDPGMAGLVAHESFGHGREADWEVGGRSLAPQYIGKPVGSELVTLVDQAYMPGMHGHYYFDDEGYMTVDPASGNPRRTVLVDKGILTNQPMTDRWSYNIHKRTNPDIVRTPNGRCEDPSKDIYVRMSNTFFEGHPDGHTVEEMIAATKKGLLIERFTDGMEDPMGWGMQLCGLRAYEIADGQLTGRVFYKPSITGFVPDFLNSIDMIGKNATGFEAGRCGKGHKEVVEVSSGGAYLRGTVNVG